MKKSFLFLLSLTLMSFGGYTQKLSLAELVNKAYNSQLLGTDTLLYIPSECVAFIDTTPDKGPKKIKIAYFKNREQLIEKLSDEDAFLLGISISDISFGSAIILMSVYKINKDLFGDKRSFVVFHDQRKIQCVLNKNKKWVYSKTIEVKNHITD